MEGSSGPKERAVADGAVAVASSSSSPADLRRNVVGPVGAARSVSEDVVIGLASERLGGDISAATSGSPSAATVHDVRGLGPVCRDDPAQISNSFLDQTAAAGNSSPAGAGRSLHSRRVTGGNFLVSEQEDEGGQPVGGPAAVDDDEPKLAVGVKRTDSLMGVQPTVSEGGEVATGTDNAVPAPAKIPRDMDEVDEGKDADGEDEEDESDYEYEYEDDECSGFLISDSHHGNVENSSMVAAAPPQDAGTHKVEDEEDEKPSAGAVASSETGVVSSLSESQSQSQSQKKPRWREPSRSAVSMSLRAESEKTGGKRRLAADLYKIMMADTDEAGFQIEPKSEDSMDLWTIRLFAFDEDSNLSKDLMVLGLNHVELEMSFPGDYPFEPPFVRVVRPRFKRQTGFVMNGALCMELLTKEGWNPVNDIESVIVSIRSLLVVGDGRLQAAVDLPEKKREALLAKAREERKLKSAEACSVTPKDYSAGRSSSAEEGPVRKKARRDSGDGTVAAAAAVKKDDLKPISKTTAGSYTTAEAKAAYSHLSDYHKKKGWDSSGWWARKG